MITKFITFLTSLILGGSALFGLVKQQASDDTTIQPSSTNRPSAVIPIVTPLPAQNISMGQQNWPFRGDSRLLRDLGITTGKVTNLQPGEVRKALQDGKSLAQIIESNGKSVTDVLTIVSEKFKLVLDRSVENEKITQSWADKMMAFLADTARRMINQPSLKPAYPSMAELRRVLLVSTGKIGNLDRTQIKDGLAACKSLDQILRDNNSGGEIVIQTDMNRINNWLAQLVSDNKITKAQQQEWSASIQVTLNDLISLPGFGKKQNCTQ